MNRSKNYLRNLIVVLLTPCAVLTAFYLLFSRKPTLVPMLCALYVLALTWVILFVRRKPCRISALPVGFLLSLAGPFVYDSLHPSSSWLFSQYLGTAAMAISFVLPWTAVTLIISVIFLMKQRKRTVNIDVFRDET